MGPLGFVKALGGPVTTPEGWRVHKRFLIGSYALFAAIGLLIPEDLRLADHPNLSAFCDFMAAIVPQIDRITAMGIKPDVNRFYFSLLWACSPPYMVYMWISGNHFVKHEWKEPRSPLILIGAAAVGLLVCAMLIFMSFGVEPITAENRPTRAMLDNKMIRVIEAPGMTIVVAVLLTWVVFMFNVALTRKIRQLKQTSHG